MRNKRASRKEDPCVSALSCLPLRSDRVEWQTSEDGRVTLRVENRGVFNRLAQLLFFRPRVSYIRLDSLGSFVWLRLDGQTRTEDIALAMEEEYGSKVQPTKERLCRFLSILRENNFIY